MSALCSRETSFHDIHNQEFKNSTIKIQEFTSFHDIHSHLQGKIRPYPHTLHLQLLWSFQWSIWNLFRRGQGLLRRDRCGGYLQFRNSRIQDSQSVYCQPSGIGSYAIQPGCGSRWYWLHYLHLRFLRRIQQTRVWDQEHWLATWGWACRNNSLGLGLGLGVSVWITRVDPRFVVHLCSIASLYSLFPVLPPEEIGDTWLSAPPLVPSAVLPLPLSVLLALRWGLLVWMRPLCFWALTDQMGLIGALTMFMAMSSFEPVPVFFKNSRSGLGCYSQSRGSLWFINHDRIKGGRGWLVFFLPG